MYVEAGAGRMIFVIPRDGKVYIGTTETEYVGDIANPPILMEDRNYLLQVINELFPDVLLTPADVESGWSGLRPLIKKENKKPGEISRKDETFIHPSGLISIAGGKLTGYRKMAERVVNLIAKRLSASFGLTIKNCITASTPISGGHFGGSLSMDAYIKNQLQMTSSLPWSDKNKELLARRYGSNFGQLLDIAKNLPVSTIDPVLLTELEYSIQYEMVLTPMDFFIRRTSKYYFEVSKFMETKEMVLDYMKNRLNWSVEMTKLVEIEMNRDLTFLLDLKK